MPSSHLDTDLEPVPDFVAMEHEVLAFWREHSCFDALRHKNRSGPVFRFLDGPITANNPMGVHHAWGRTLKDVFQRYRSLQGYTSHWQNGFDAQGLWVEVEVEKELGFNSKRDIEQYGVERFIERCKERVATYAAVQTAQSIRLGQWMRWDESYFTNTDENIQGIWHFLKRCHENGWIVRKQMPLGWCPRCGTSLSEHEAAGSHQDVTHLAPIVRARLADGRCALVWTTTAWTLPANVALAVHPAAVYCEVVTSGERLVVAQDALSFAGLRDPVIERVFSGSELVGLAYETFFGDLPAQAAVSHHIVAWPEVNPADGTGIVHIAPGCGAEDFELGRSEGLPVIAPIDENGRYVAAFGWLTGRSTSEATPAIIASLEERGLLFSASDYRHSYPVCWRCKTETVFRISEEWFIRADPIRSRMLAAAAGVRWEPDHAGKRMQDWLTNMSDWNISRKRFYGMPLPFYPCRQCGQLTVVGSRDELMRLAVDPAAQLRELHRPWVDEVRIHCPRCSAPTARVPEVGDAWLDAGIVPFTTFGYFSDRARWQTLYPAEWVTEMREQVRLWFYSMLFMSVTLLDRSPYERVLAYESVVSEDLRKFSKTGFMIAFDDAVESMGADVMRYLYARAPVGASVRFGFTLGDEIRKQLLSLWNVFGFFHTYAALDQPRLDEAGPDMAGLSDIDSWLLARTNEFLDAVTVGYDKFATPDVIRAFESFVHDLSNWYIRVNRKRIWRGDNREDKHTAYWCLSSTLAVTLQAMSPILPFITEVLWQKVIRRYDARYASTVSVHLADWPRQFAVHDSARRVLDDTRIAREAINLALRLRNEHGLKVRQPLLRLHIVAEASHRAAIERMRDVIADQVNVKEVALLEEQERLQVSFLTLDFGAAGPTLKGGVKDLKGRLEQLIDEEMAAAVAQFDSGQAVEIPGSASFPASFFQRNTRTRPSTVVASGESLTVALDTELPDWLIQEGLARDLVRQLQVLRKSTGYRVDERIQLAIHADEPLVLSAIHENRAYIVEQTLATSLTESLVDADVTVDVEVGGSSIHIAMRRSAAASATSA